jgi:hypothetical protein
MGGAKGTQAVVRVVYGRISCLLEGFYNKTDRTYSSHFLWNVSGIMLFAVRHQFNPTEKTGPIACYKPR